MCLNHVVDVEVKCTFSPRPLPEDTGRPESEDEIPATDASRPGEEDRPSSAVLDL